MKNKFIAGLTLSLMLAAGSAFAENAYQKDIQLFDQKEINIVNSVVTNGVQTTINDVAKDLGALKEVRYFDKAHTHDKEKTLLTHAFYENGEIWMSGKVANDQVAPVGRMITKRLDVETAKGLKVGDSFEKIIELYGEPQYIHWNRLNKDDNKEVDRWFIYFCQEPYEKGTRKSQRPAITKLMIGIKDFQVSRIGYSGMWRKGL